MSPIWRHQVWLTCWATTWAWATTRRPRPTTMVSGDWSMDSAFTSPSSTKHSAQSEWGPAMWVLRLVGVHHGQEHTEQGPNPAISFQRVLTGRLQRSAAKWQGHLPVQQAQLTGIVQFVRQRRGGRERRLWLWQDPRMFTKGSVLRSHYVQAATRGRVQRRGRVLRQLQGKSKGPWTRGLWGDQRSVTTFARGRLFTPSSVFFGSVFARQCECKLMSKLGPSLPSNHCTVSKLHKFNLFWEACTHKLTNLLEYFTNLISRNRLVSSLGECCLCVVSAQKEYCFPFLTFRHFFFLFLQNDFPLFVLVDFS